MTEVPKTTEDGAEARLHRRRLSWIWLIPVASLGIGLWLVWSNLSRRGPMINVSFPTAEGLQAGQTQVKFKDIQMGTVEAFDLSEDRSRVIMHLRMSRKAEPLLTEGASFWVVKPRLFAGDVVGLSTLVSGSYMEMSPGQQDQPDRRDFVGLKDPPALAAGTAGHLFQLTTPRLGAISIGSPVFFRDVEVGKVVDWKLTGMAEKATIGVFIDAPYDQWVHERSRFWNTSGIALKLGAEGVQLQVNSVKSALLGGVTFDTPDDPGPAVAGGDSHLFTLYANEQTAEAETSKQRYKAVTYLTGSIGGLSVGAPVALAGLRVGEVTEVQLQFDKDHNRPRVRVGFTVRAEKVVPVGNTPSPKFPEGFRVLVENGLRTSLKGGSIITGQKLLALEIEPDAAPAEFAMEGDVAVIPSNGSAGGGIDDLSATANQLLARIGKMPFEQIGQNLNGSLSGVSAIVNGQPLKEALIRLSGTLAAAQDLVKHLDAGVAPAMRRLPAIASELQDSLTQVRVLVTAISAGSASNNRFGRNLDLTLSQVADAALSVRMVADLLSRHPEALIRGRTSGAAQ